MVLLSPKNCNANSHKIKTIKDAILLPSKSLTELKKDYGKDWVIGYISMWLLDLNDNANVKQKMNGAQIEFTAERIYDTYFIKVTDLTLFFRNIKEGKYGGYYENMSQEKIMEWMRIYFDERCEYAEILSQSKGEKFSPTKDKLHPDVIKRLAEIAKEIEDEKNAIIENNTKKTEWEKEYEKNGMGKRLRDKFYKK